MKPIKSPFASALWPLAVALVMAGTYAGVFYSQKAGMVEQFDYWTSRIPSIVLYNGGMALTLKGYALSWGAFVGAALAVVYLLLAYLLLGVAALARATKMRAGAAFVYLAATAPFVALAVLIHGEPTPRTAIAAAVLAFTTAPLWISALVSVGLAVALFLAACFYAPRQAK